MDPLNHGGKLSRTWFRTQRGGASVARAPGRGRPFRHGQSPCQTERYESRITRAFDHLDGFTGGAASIEARLGGRHTAWDGYIEGQILELEPGRRIVRSWRTTDFGKKDRDSRLEILLTPHRGGTKLTLIHTDLPKGGAAQYDEGWREHYFEPMKKYFSGPAKKPSKKTTARRS